MVKQRRRTPDEARELILRAAAREFAALGYGGASTAQVARRAEVTQPLVHHYFGSKEGLWGAVLADLFERLGGALDRAAEAGKVSGGESTTQTLRLVRALIHFSGQHPELSRLIRGESVAGGERFEAMFAGYLAPLIRRFETSAAGVVREGGLAAQDVQFAYFAVIGAATQLFAEPETARRAFGLEPTDAGVIERYADFVAELLTRGLLGPPRLPPKQEETPGVERPRPARKAPPGP